MGLLDRFRKKKPPSNAEAIRMSEQAVQRQQGPNRDRVGVTTGPAAAATKMVTGQEPGILPCSCLHEATDHEGPARRVGSCQVDGCNCGQYDPISRSEFRRQEFERARAESDLKAVEQPGGPVDRPGEGRSVEQVEGRTVERAVLTGDVLAVAFDGPKDTPIRVEMNDVWERLDKRRPGQVQVVGFTEDVASKVPLRAIVRRPGGGTAMIQLTSFRAIARGYKLVERGGPRLA